MANPSTRQGLIDYCLRKLGAPVLEVNVDEDQLEDRVDESIQFYREYNSDATVKTFLKHEITADDVTNGYIEIDDSILFVQKIFPFGGGQTSGGGAGFFNVSYQMSLNDMYSLRGGGGGMANFAMTKQYTDLISNSVSGSPLITFSRHQNRIYVHAEFEEGTLSVGDYIVFEVWQAINPETFTDIYNDIHLKDYLIQLIKQQWGQNLIKFEGMQLPGGVTLNGRQFYDDATQEIDRLREQMRLTHELPVDFMVG